MLFVDYLLILFLLLNQFSAVNHVLTIVITDFCKLKKVDIESIAQRPQVKVLKPTLDT